MKHEGLPFAMVPIEAFIDQRLTLTQHRVLGALLSFRGRDTEIIWPSREALSARTGLAVEKISNATTALCKLGWLTKDGCGGRSRSCRYRITVPDELTVRASAAINGENNTVPESGTVTHNTVPESGTVTHNTVPESGTVKSRNGARIGHETVPESGTGIEETKNIPEKKELSLSLSSPSSDPVAPTTQALALVPPVAKVATDWPGFDDFWIAYPEKKSKKDARTAWNKLRPSSEIIKAILADLPRRIAQDRRWLDGYIPNPATYLNGERWQDSITPKINGSHHVPRPLSKIDVYTHLDSLSSSELFGYSDRPEERRITGEVL